MSVSDEIERLQHLHDTGAIDDVEFAAAKARVLNPPNLFGFPTGPVTPPTGEALAQQTQKWALFLHLSLLLGYVVVPGAGLVAPILIWQLKKEELPGLDVHGRNAVNWMISSLIYAAASGVLCFVGIGFPMLLAVILCSIIFPVIAASKANSGEVWKYPMSIDFITK
ncbi:MAG: DUF4870 domain-containing protein [Planctomycetes bacterium]|nr:DUF4870 domain-containing protein [Planctomycetota bacterium]